MFDKSIKELWRTSNMFFIWIDKVWCPNIMIWLNEGFGFKTDEGYPRLLNTFYFIHFLSSYPYFLSTKRIICSNLFIEEGLSFIVNLLDNPLEWFISSCFNFFSQWFLCFAIQRKSTINTSFTFWYRFVSSYQLASVVYWDFAFWIISVLIEIASLISYQSYLKQLHLVLQDQNWWSIGKIYGYRIVKSSVFSLGTTIYEHF